MWPAVYHRGPEPVCPCIPPATAAAAQERNHLMSHLTTGGRRVIAAISLLGLLATGAACGTQTDTVKDVGANLSGSTTQQDRSGKALDADARRAARGQLPTPTPPPTPAGNRVPPDYLP